MNSINKEAKNLTFRRGSEVVQVSAGLVWAQRVQSG